MKLLSLLGLPFVSSFKIAFVGDTGAQLSGQNGYFALSLYEMLVSHGVQLLVQNGDLDYNSDPQEWDDFIVEHAISKGMDLLISSGNHEEQIAYGRPWYGRNGYKRRLEDRYEESALLSGNCDGDYGERFHCEFNDILVIMLGWKQTGSSSEMMVSARMLREVLEATDKKIKFCTWHKPEGKVNPGDVHTSNYEMQELYEICRQYGAIITSGHSHVYGRTKVISSFLPDGEEPDDNPDPVVSPNDSHDPTVGCGETFSVVAGMGGYKFDSDGIYAKKSYFRARVTQSLMGQRAGAMICEIPDVIGDNEDAVIPCEFRLSTEDLIESFVVTVKSSSYGNACKAMIAPTPSPVDDCFLFFC